MGMVGTAAVAAAVAAVGLLWESSASQLQPTAAAPPLLSHVLTTDVTARAPVMPTVAIPAARSLVALEVRTSSHVTLVCGMAVDDAGLVAAPAAPLMATGAKILLATADGTAPATEVAVDRSSDVALVRVPVAVHPPPVADDATMSAGRHAIVLAVTTGAHGTSPGISWSTATIASVTRAVPAGTATGIAGIVTTAAAPARSCGALLLDAKGSVVGLLDGGGGSGASGTEVFLPAPLVIGVSDQLAVAGTVRHGWLDVSATDAPASSDGGRGGAAVGTVDPVGAAAGVLHSGDVILRVSGEPVRSVAELRARLYVLPPGATVSLEVLRGGRPAVMDVELGGSP